jgi:hypothetical protein
VQTIKAGNLKIEGGLLEWWELSYKIIRTLNEFIEKVEASDVIEESTKEVRIAEARFLRAFNYFAMVKRYGGVPLIKKVQSVDDPKEELFAARNTEQEVYDYIIAEVDAITGANGLPEENDYGRATKYAALALKSRAALYAGSIAKYGSVQLNGLLGIPAGAASDYYQKSYDASNEIIQSDKFALYDVDADKAMNFRNIFVAKQNSEVIMVKRHNDVSAFAGGNAWSYDFFQAPKPHAWNAGNKDAPYLEMAEAFEYIDGTPGTLDRTAIQEGLWSMDELWGNKDPRFFATLYTMGTQWQGTTIDPHNGLLLPDGTIQSTGNYEGIPAKGTQVVDNMFNTSFGVLKYLDEETSNMSTYSNASSDYIIFRYGEILLNQAEAALELSKSNEALTLVNQIRTRAGIANLADISMEKIQQERRVELAFEGHRYWDLRRRRIAEKVLSQPLSGIQYILDVTTNKYKIVVLENYKARGVNADPKFYDYNYYLPITLERTGNNPNLVENPGY